MATVKFYLTSDKPNSSVYIRFSASRSIEFRRKTGITISNPKEDWSNPKNLPKTNTAENKNINTKLKSLCDYILRKYNDDFNDNTSDRKEINSIWLKDNIDSFFNRAPVNDREYFTQFAKDFVVEMHTKTYTVKNVKKEFSPITIEKYQNVARHIEEFEIFKKKKFKIIDITNDYTEDIAKYMSDVKGLSTNTIGRDVKRIKTMILDAESKGFKVSHKVKQIRGFEDKKIVVSLSFDEIDKIIGTDFKDDKLIRAKDWLVIACYTGQRISDLWRMRKNMIIQEGKYRYILLNQYKTNKRVKVPIHYHVEDVLAKYNDDFPAMYSLNEKSNRSILSELMKTVCRRSGITETIEGRLNGKFGAYEKWKLISNHSCRRSFASNFYGNPIFTTPMLMEITGHVKESNFLTYIGEEDFKFSERTAQGFEMLRQQDEARKKSKVYPNKHIA
ncbi:MAG TPA: phage integrase SAM-like domain-containing protein [Flavobacterium sp.]|jgi:integrase